MCLTDSRIRRSQYPYGAILWFSYQKTVQQTIRRLLSYRKPGLKSVFRERAGSSSRPSRCRYRPPAEPSSHHHWERTVLDCLQAAAEVNASSQAAVHRSARVPVSNGTTLRTRRGSTQRNSVCLRPDIRRRLSGDTDAGSGQPRIDHRLGQAVEAAGIRPSQRQHWYLHISPYLPGS